MLIYKNTIPSELSEILSGDKIPFINFEDEFDILGIKGDNLQGLYALLETHKSSVKLAYADVPYNTGNKDFIYNDTFNTTESINFHSDWISWMLPRLIATRELLREDGALVISIDHNERLNLENLCIEVFGSQNVLSLVTVVSNKGGGGRRNTKDLVTTNEYLVVCTKNIDSWESGMGVFNESKTVEKKPRSIVAYNQKLVYHRRGQFFPILIDKKTNEVTTIPADEYQNLKDFIFTVCEGYHGKKSNKSYDEDLHSKIDNFVKQIHQKYEKTHKVIFPLYKCKWGRWLVSYESVLNKVAPYDILFENSNGVINYWEEIKDFRPMKTILDENSYSNTTATETLKKLYGEKNFDTPKSPILMRDIITQFTNDGDIVIDWCAGSNSTYHGLLLADKLQNSERKYIFIQQDENSVDIFTDHSLRRVQIVNEIENVDRRLCTTEVEFIETEKFYVKEFRKSNKENFIHSVESTNMIYQNKIRKFEKIYNLM